VLVVLVLIARRFGWGCRAVSSKPAH